MYLLSPNFSIEEVSWQEKFMGFLYGMTGKSQPINEKQALRIADLAEKYPRVKATVISWAATNADHTLTAREGAVLYTAANRLAQIEKNWSDLQSERDQTLAGLRSLNRFGLIDQAKASASGLHAAIDSSPTKSEPSHTRPSRM